jgi:hypothetical protein
MDRESSEVYTDDAGENNRHDQFGDKLVSRWGN